MLSPFKDIGHSALKYIGQKGATGVRDLMKRVGVCHYLIAFRKQNDHGKYHVFDFGPVDLEVAFSNKEKGLIRVEEEPEPEDTLRMLQQNSSSSSNGMNRTSRKNKKKKGKSKAVKGEVRERFVDSLCKDHLQVGTTSMSIQDIRDLSDTLPQNYELHVNDCRHFVNTVAEAATGVKRATLLSGRTAIKKDSVLRFWSPFELGMVITDYQNFPWFQQQSRTFATAIAAISGGRLGWNLLRPLHFNFTSTVMPSLVKTGGKQLVEKPLRNSAITTCATAIATFHETAFFREGVRLTKDIGDSLKAMAGAVEGVTVGASASAIHAIGSLGARAMQPFGSLSPLESFVTSVNSCATRTSRAGASLSQVLHLPRRLTKVNATAKGLAESLPSASDAAAATANPLSTVSVVLKHLPLPTFQMNKALQGRCMRLARPAYQFTIGANIGQ